MKNKITSLLFLLTFLFTIKTAAQVVVDYDELDEFLIQSFEAAEIPALAVGIIKDGEVVFKKAYGYSNLQQETPVNTESIFGIASLSKAFTAAAIGILVDEGKLNLNDKVQNYLPWFNLHEPYVSSQVTIEDLLCHRVGLTTFDGDLLWYGTDYDREEVIKRIDHLPLKNGFRYRYGYQNVMFIAAGEVIEEVTGKTWDEFVKERIFDPLGMSNTNTSTSEYEEGKNWALPYVDNRVIDFINYDNSGPAASINSSLDDLLKWVELWLNKGTFNDKQIFSEQFFTAATNVETSLPVSPGDKRDINFFGYGLGWFVMDFADSKLVEHGGGLPGVHTKIAFVPEHNFGFVLLSNQINGLMDPLMYELTDRFLRGHQREWVNEGLEGFNAYINRLEMMEERRIEERVMNTNPSLSDSGYIGMYEDEMYGPAKVELINDKLVITLIPTNELFTSVMEHWHYDTFKVEFADKYLPPGYINFDLNTNGKVSGFTIDLPNPDFHFYNLDFKKIK